MARIASAPRTPPTTPPIKALLLDDPDPDPDPDDPDVELGVDAAVVAVMVSGATDVAESDCAGEMVGLVEDVELEPEPGFPYAVVEGPALLDVTAESGRHQHAPSE
jgi:hypothetical protein